MFKKNIKKNFLKNLLLQDKVRGLTGDFSPDGNFLGCSKAPPTKGGGFQLSNILKFAIFCFVGVTSALIHLIIFNLFFWILNNLSNKGAFLFGASRNYIIATIIAIAVSIIYNFNMNRTVTFSARDESIKKQIPRYAIVYGLSISVNFIVSLIVITLIGETTINANIATFAGIITSIPVSFLGSLLWTFRKKKN